MKLLLMLLTMGCESRPNVNLGQTFQPVKLKKHTPKSSISPVEEEKSDSEEDFVMTSEESVANFEKQQSTSGTNEKTTSQVMEIDLRSSAPPKVDSNVVPVKVEPADIQQPRPAFSWKEWPIQVLKVMPEFQPPRALVGLPNGEDIVVSAGKMLPEFGLVVMSVGQHDVHFVKISAMGNRAKVQPIRLTPQQ